MCIGAYVETMCIPYNRLVYIHMYIYVRISSICLQFYSRCKTPTFLRIVSTTILSAFAIYFSVSTPHKVYYIYIHILMTDLTTVCLARRSTRIHIQLALFRNQYMVNFKISLKGFLITSQNFDKNRFLKFCFKFL